MTFKKKSQLGLSRLLRSNDVWGWNLIEFHKRTHLVNIEASRLPTKILPRIFYLLINSGIPHPFFRYALTYLFRRRSLHHLIRQKATKWTTYCSPDLIPKLRIKIFKFCFDQLEQVTKQWHLLESCPQTKYLQQQASMKFPITKSLKSRQMTCLQIWCLQLLLQHTIQIRYQIPKFWGILQLKFLQIKCLQPVGNPKQELWSL